MHWEVWDCEIGNLSTMCYEESEMCEVLIWVVLECVRRCQRVFEAPRHMECPPITSRPAQAWGNPHKQLLRLKHFDQTHLSLSLSGVWMGCKRWQWLGWIVCLPPCSVAFHSPGYNYLCLDRTSPPPPPPYREQTQVRTPRVPSRDRASTYDRVSRVGSGISPPTNLFNTRRLLTPV